MTSKTNPKRRRGKRSVALMKTLPPEVIQYIATFIGETKFRYLANVRYVWMLGHGIERLWLNIEWAVPHSLHKQTHPRTITNDPSDADPRANWIKMSRGPGFDPEVTDRPPVRQIKSVHTLLAQYKFILKALSLPHQLFNAHPDGPTHARMHRYWRADADGRWRRNRTLGNQPYFPYYACM